MFSVGEMSCKRLRCEDQTINTLTTTTVDANTVNANSVNVLNDITVTDDVVVYGTVYANTIQRALEISAPRGPVFAEPGIFVDGHVVYTNLIRHKVPVLTPNPFSGVTGISFDELYTQMCVYNSVDNADVVCNTTAASIISTWGFDVGDEITVTAYTATSVDVLGDWAIVFTGTGMTTRTKAYRTTSAKTYLFQVASPTAINVYIN